jgi:hypothetical protein
MSHHYPGPDFAFPHGDARLNFTDLFAFPKPGDGSKSILIMDVHPSIGINPPGPTTTEPFSTKALYELMIDTDGDCVVNIAYSVRFAATEEGEQTATVRRIEGTRSDRTRDDGEVIVADAPVSVGREPTVTTAGDYRFFAGWRSDPFFFDALGAVNNLTFTGQDFFADKNVCCIVLEAPNSALGSARLQVWARTLDGASGSWVQADRGARASQEPFLAGDEKAAYISGEPANDARFIAVFAHSLEHTGSYTSEEATRAAGTLLPDVLPYQPGRQASYPSNGRALTDDAAAHFLTVLSNGKVTGDGLRPHTDLLAEFPYVGLPHSM